MIEVVLCCYICITLYAYFVVSFLEVCKRLIVLKNGVRDVSKSVAVVGPDLTNVSTQMSTFVLFYSQ